MHKSRGVQPYYAVQFLKFSIVFSFLLIIYLSYSNYYRPDGGWYHLPFSRLITDFKIIFGSFLNNGREGQTEVVPATNNDEPPKHLTPYALGGTTDNNMPNDLTTTPPINPPDGESREKPRTAQENQRTPKKTQVQSRDEVTC